ncbi:MAG: hypothetical protein ACSNEK_09255 [Parachlamydiaceae bacterium]
MRKITYWLGLLCCSLSCFSVSTADAEDAQELERVKPGTRAMVLAEWVKIQEERAQEETSQNEPIDEVVEEEKKNSILPNASSFNVSANFVTPQASINYTTHTGAFYYPVAISALGDSIELNDRSVWLIASSDTKTAMNWLRQQEMALANGGPGLSMVITPNHSWFSSYQFCLTEQTTGTSVKANLYLGPLYNGLFTHWIVAINYYTQEICLEDGSLWKLSGLDAGVYNHWLINDTVIIGVNDGFLSSSKPNILINVNALTYSRAKCIY